jgi:hypothetical protein
MPAFFLMAGGVQLLAALIYLIGRPSTRLNVRAQQDRPST